MKPISKIEIIITIIVIAAIAFLIINHKKDAQIVRPITIDVPDNSVVAPIEWPSVAISSETIQEKNKNYSIRVNYPVTADEYINNTFKNYAYNQIDQFKKDIDWVNDTEDVSSSDGLLTLDINYKENRSKRADNYVFSIVTYTGGAHGLEITETINYDKNGRKIELFDLFTNGQEGLKTVSSYVQEQLNKLSVSDKDWIAEGAAPNSQNYRNFLVTDNGVTFIFDPYQVAPYAAGIQKIEVPISVFKNIANKNIFE